MLSQSVYAPNVLVSDVDAEFIASYIENKGLNSDKTAGNVKSAIKEFLTIYQGSLADVDVADVEVYIAALALTGRKVASQKAFFKMVSALIKTHRLAEAKITKVVRVNPFDLFDVKTIFAMDDPKRSTTLAEDRAIQKEETYTLDQMKALILKAKDLTNAASPKEVANKCFFPVVLLQIFSSPRIGETLSIKLENIDLTERMFKSGIVRNARKSGTVYGFFPPVVAALLREWMLAHKVTGPWLFAGYLGNKLNVIYFRTLFQKLGFKSHHFRHSLYTEMKDETQKMAEIEELSNHAHSGVIEKHYIKSKLETQRDLYDKHLPAMYQELARWLETL